MSRPDIDALEAAIERANSGTGNPDHLWPNLLNVSAVAHLCAYIRTLEADQSAAISQAVQVERERAECYKQDRDNLYEQTVPQVASLTAELASLRAATEAVMSLHRSEYRSTSDEVWERDPYCSSCRTVWPCDTVAALRSEGASKEARPDPCPACGEVGDDCGGCWIIKDDDDLSRQIKAAYSEKPVDPPEDPSEYRKGFHDGVTFAKSAFEEIHRRSETNAPAPLPTEEEAGDAS